MMFISVDLADTLFYENYGSAMLNSVLINHADLQKFAGNIWFGNIQSIH